MLGVGEHQKTIGIDCGARWENCRLVMLSLDQGMNSLYTQIGLLMGSSRGTFYLNNQSRN